MASGGNYAPLQVPAQTPVGRAPELPLDKDDEAVAVCTPVDEESELLALVSDVAMLSK